MIAIEPFNYREYDVEQYAYEDHGDMVRIIALGRPTSLYHVRVIQDDNGQERQVYFSRIYATIWAARIEIEKDPDMVAMVLRRQLTMVIDRVWRGEIT